MKRYLFQSMTLLAFLLVILKPAFATVDLELTQGMSQALPIAVVPFSGQPNLSAPDNVASVISADLKNSGRFRLVEHSVDSARANDYAYWRSVGADSVVTGTVKSLGGTQYEVAFELIDPINASHVLLSEKFTVQSNALRALAHHISDLIFQKLTGIPGIFSTRMAYIVFNPEGVPQTRYQLEVADIDGYSPHALLTSSQPIMSPAWSPDGSKIAYVSFEKKRSQIYYVDVRTGQRRLITSYSGINSAPAWSPDGRKMAVVLSKSGHPEIYLVDMLTGALTQITHSDSINTEPSFSPDGKAILFMSDRGGSPQIYRYDFGTAQTTRVTYDGSYNATGSYTSDSTQIVLLHRVSGQYNIGVQDVRSGIVTPLTNGGNDISPSVAPNGQMILYSSRYQGRASLALVSVDGRIQLTLPSREGTNVQNPAWSPYKK
jgi:TolB protein